MGEPDTEIIPSVYAQLATMVGPFATLRDLRLAELKCQLGKIEESDPTLARLERGYGVDRDDNQNVLRVIVKLKMSAAYDNDASKAEPPVVIEMTYALAYEIENMNSFSDEQLAAFGRVNGEFNVWPFFRELVFNMYGRMGLSPKVLPSLHVESSKPSSN